MKSPHLLRIGVNPRKIKENLVGVVDITAINAIEAAICANALQLYVLGRGHYDFAIRQNGRAWRQKVSRLYYAAFNVSRAVRLCVSGDYSTELGEHKKIESLPDDFPNRNKYFNRLGVLRDDRNLCDYDHTAEIGDLVVSPAAATELVGELLRDAQSYLKQRGIKV